jgi:hypothetical protein
LAAQAIGRVGDILQLVQHKAGNQKRAGQESGFGDVSHASIDDHARIQ